MSLAAFGKTLISIAALLFVVGLVLITLDRLGLGRLPGDLVWRRGGTRVYFPVVTGLVVSVVLTVIINLALWWWRR